MKASCKYASSLEDNRREQVENIIKNGERSSVKPEMTPTMKILISNMKKLELVNEKI
jgi:hypothetical protein